VCEICQQKFVWTAEWDLPTVVCPYCGQEYKLCVKNSTDIRHQWPTWWLEMPEIISPASLPALDGLAAFSPPIPPDPQRIRAKME